MPSDKSRIKDVQQNSYVSNAEPTIKRQGYYRYYTTEGHASLQKTSIEEAPAEAKPLASRQPDDWSLPLEGSSHDISQRQSEKEAFEKDCQSLYSLFENFGQSTYLEKFREGIKESYDTFLDSCKNIQISIQEKKANGQNLSEQDYLDVRNLKKFIKRFSKGIKIYGEIHKEYLESFKKQKEVLKRFLGHQDINKLCSIKQDTIPKIIHYYEFNQEHIEKWIPALEEFSEHEEYKDAQKLDEFLKKYEKKLQQARRPLDIIDTTSIFADADRTIRLDSYKALAEPEKDLLEAIRKLSEQENITLKPKVRPAEIGTAMEEID